MNPIFDLDANPSEYPRVGRETNACGFQKQGWRATHGLWIIGNGFWGITPYTLLPITHKLITCEESFGETVAQHVIIQTCC